MTTEAQREAIQAALRRQLADLEKPGGKERARRYLIDVLKTHHEDGTLTEEYGGPRRSENG